MLQVSMVEGIKVQEPGLVQAATNQGPGSGSGSVHALELVLAQNQKFHEAIKGACRADAEVPEAPRR
jgi:hypothetical protein